MPGPAWVFVALKLDNRDSNYVNEILHSKTLGTSARGEKRRIVSGLVDLLKGSLSGVHAAKLWVGATADTGSSGAYPAGNVACVQSTSAGSTVTFTWGGAAIVLTEGVHFLRGGSNTTEAAALAAAINAHPILSGLMSAVGSVGNCVLTGKIPGSLLHDILIAGGNGFTPTQFAAGAEFTAALQLQAINLGRTV